jgi:hypothetical protein
MWMILSLIPTEAWALVFVGLGLGVMVGRVRAATVGGVVLMLLLLPFMSALVDVVFDAMPLWMLLLVCVGLVASMFRLVLGLMLGRRAADAAVGHLAAMAIWSLVTVPFRIARRIL